MLNRVEMMSRQLETMSDQIEGALDDLQIEHGEGLIGTITPRSFRFGVPRVSFQIGCLTEDELNETISTALGVERDSVVTSLDEWMMEVGVKRGKPAKLALSAVIRGLEGVRYSTALGMTDVAEPLALNISSSDARNVSIAGRKGSGKSGLLRAMMQSHAQRHPDDRQIILGGPDLSEGLSGACEEVVRRERGEASLSARVVVAIEGVDFLLGESETERMIYELLERGPSQRVHVIGTTSNQAALEELRFAMEPDPFPARVEGSGVAEGVFPGEFVLLLPQLEGMIW
ncbi:hypothetical protein ISS86_02800 [Candidatus Microgenomates bacterium]|nr:hypothetical protein [Candidatus Microgenomates bacterium]